MVLWPLLYFLMLVFHKYEHILYKTVILFLLYDNFYMKLGNESENTLYGFEKF